MRPCCSAGILDKFIGDAIMACFGVPFVSADDGKTDACMSCKCALEQMGALEIFNERRQAKLGMDTETFAIGGNALSPTCSCAARPLRIRCRCAQRC
jgi:class 3 adenylate cyclase